MTKFSFAHYPGAEMLVILCDGGGSNSSRHHIVKQDFMDLSDRLGLKILVMHYPPYCSKFNPIEHRLFSQITRSWSGAPLISVVNACQRAAQTVTKTGLKVFATIVDKAYQTKRKVCESFQERLAKQVVFDDALHRWKNFEETKKRLFLRGQKKQVMEQSLFDQYWITR